MSLNDEERTWLLSTCDPRTEPDPSAADEFHVNGYAEGSVTTEVVERHVTFFHTLIIEDGIDVIVRHDGPKNRWELRVSQDGLKLIDKLVREATYEQHKRLLALEAAEESRLVRLARALGV